VNALPTILQNKMTIVIIYNSRKDTSNDGKEIGKKKTRKWRRQSNIDLPTSMFPKWQFAWLFVLSSLLLLPLAMELPFGIQAFVPLAGRPKQQQHAGNLMSPSWHHGNVARKKNGSDLTWRLHANSRESMDDFSSAGGIDDNDDTQQNAKRKKYSFGRFGGRKRTTVQPMIDIIPEPKKKSTSWLPGALVAAGLVLWALLPGGDTAMNSPHDHYYYYYSYSYSSNTVYNDGAKTLENVQSNLQTNIPKNYLVLTEPATTLSTSSSSSNLEQQQRPQQQLPPRPSPLAPATDRDIIRMLDQQLPQEFRDKEAMMMMRNAFRTMERIMDES
jgi:hypothetical protein